MSEATFEILAGGDDGAAQLDGAFFGPSYQSTNMGDWTPLGWHNFFRFDNVTIPSGANIDSAIIRFTCSTSSSGTVNLDLHFEDADDPAAPTSGADLVGRSLTAAVDWDGVAAWVQNNTYDTPEISTILQNIVDRGGWTPGNAVTLHVKDSGSDTNQNRYPACYENTTYDSAQLIVTYSVPYNIDLSDSVEVTESISIEMDLALQENITVSESVTMRRSLIDLPTVDDSVEISEYTDLLLGFDESLPLISENITISESLTITRGLGGLPLQSENIELTESVGLLIGFGESLPEFSESITITEYQLIDVGPQITVFESITVNDYGNIQPEFSVSDNLSLAESVTVRRGYQVAVDDSALFSDTFTLFNYTSWFRTNKARSKERFFLTLTGAADQIADVVIPVSNITATKRSGDPSYLQVTIPTFKWSADIALRPSAEMIVEMGYEIDGYIQLKEQILITNMENITTYEGPINRSIILSGTKTIGYGGNLITFERRDVIYRSLVNNGLVFRFAFVDPFVNPGDTVLISDSTQENKLEVFTCGRVYYEINANRSIMELSETP